MGTVYRAVHAETDQAVAVKVLAAEFAADPALSERFRQECSVATRLRHPHIVRGLAFGTEGVRPYLVMELVEGPTLKQRVGEGGPLPESEAVRLGLQLADALDLAHRSHLVHRDVKPENVLLTGSGEAKLADLGLVKDLKGGAGLTRTWAGLGTLAYMAPEQFEDARNADPRCDVYGLAGTLYYALSGVVPFPGRGYLTVLQNKLGNRLVPLGSLVPALSERVEQAIGRALEASPESRPASCAAFAASLGEPDRASTARARSGRERRAARRYPTALGAACSPLQGEGQWAAEVQDVSLTGVRLGLGRRFEPGAVLRVEVGASTSWLVRVRWVGEGKDGQWRLGCEFSRELSEEELKALLGGEPATVVLCPGGKDAR
jgi:serine/threonine protein kinase